MKCSGQVYSIGDAILQCCKMEATIIMSCSIEISSANASNEWETILFLLILKKKGQLVEECAESNEQLENKLIAVWNLGDFSWIFIFGPMTACVCVTANNGNNIPGFCIRLPGDSCGGNVWGSRLFLCSQWVVPCAVFGVLMVAVVPVGSWECLGWVCSAEHSWLSAGGVPEEALEASQGLGRMSCAREALVPAGLCWWVSYSYPGINQNVKHSPCSQTLKEQLVSFKMMQKRWAIPVIHLC